MYASLIYLYQADGKLIKVIKSPDGHHFPISGRESTQGGNRYSAPDTGENWAENPLGIIDIYDLLSGEYEKSIKIPFNHVRGKFDVNNNVMYISTGYEGKTLLHVFE